MSAHLFGAGDPGAAKARKQRRRDAGVRNARRARARNTQPTGTGAASVTIRLPRR
jgi:hypothetical protein